LSRQYKDKFIECDFGENAHVRAIEHKIKYDLETIIEEREQDTKSPTDMDIPLVPLEQLPFYVNPHDQQAIDRAIERETFEQATSARYITRHGRDMNIDATAFVRMKPLGLLNDDIINGYLRILEDSINKAQLKNVPSFSVLSTHFVSKLTQNHEDKSLRDMLRFIPCKSIDRDRNWLDGTTANIIVPINIPGHWLLAVVQPRAMVITCYDSLLQSSIPHQVYTLELFVEQEWRRLNGTSPSKWKVVAEHCPYQENGSDCGIFTCLFANCIMAGWSMNFNQMIATNYRNYMALCIMKSGMVAPTGNRDVTSGCDIDWTSPFTEKKDSNNTQQSVGPEKGYDPSNRPERM
jgi:sentrin-specific protease 1